MERRFVDEKELSELLPVSPNSLRVWRSQGRGPSYIKLGDNHRGRILYDLQVVYEWLSSHTIKPGEYKYLKVSKRK